MDNKSDRVESANAATRLIDYEKVVVMVGPAISGSMLAVGPICEEKQIPVISASATSPLVTQGKNLYSGLASGMMIRLKQLPSLPVVSFKPRPQLFYLILLKTIV